MLVDGLVASTMRFVGRIECLFMFARFALLYHLWNSLLSSPYSGEWSR